MFKKNQGFSPYPNQKTKNRKDQSIPENTLEALGRISWKIFTPNTVDFLGGFRPELSCFLLGSLFNY
jgi:hypothetical protein